MASDLAVIAKALTIEMPGLQQRPIEKRLRLLIAGLELSYPDYESGSKNGALQGVLCTFLYKVVL